MQGAAGALRLRASSARGTAPRSRSQRASRTRCCCSRSPAGTPSARPARLLRSLNGGATWRSVKAPHYPQLDYNGHALAFDPAKPSTALMIAANGSALGALYRSTDAGLTGSACVPPARCAAPSSTSSPSPPTAARSRLVRIGGRQNLMFCVVRRRPALERRSGAEARHQVAAGLRLAARRERHVVPARDEQARLLAPGDGCAPLGPPLRADGRLSMAPWR